VLDHERILAKVDELDGYQRELTQIVPATYAEYLEKGEKRRACERLLQISIQCVIDICGLLVAGFRLGLPAEEEDLFEKLERAHFLVPEITKMLQTMRGFRNILVHEYGGVDNAIVFQRATSGVRDFAVFRNAVLQILRTYQA
jgi:uncharacterized protein YutE (UPF0331/DUF86 family)